MAGFHLPKRLKPAQKVTEMRLLFAVKLDDLLARLRQRHAPATPLEQYRRQFGLQQLDLPGDRRWGDVQQVGSRANAAATGSFVEIGNA